MKKIILIGLILLSKDTNAESIFPHTQAAADTIPSREVLFSSLREFHQQETGAKVAPVNIGKKYRWMRWMPTFGLSYNILADKPRPNIGFSFSQVIQNLDERQKRKLENKKILRGAVLSFKNDSLELESLLEKREVMLESWESKMKALEESLKAFQNVAKLETATFRLEERRNEDGKVLPSEWLKIQAAYIRAQYPLLAKQEEIRIYESGIYESVRILESEIKKTAKN